MARRLTAAVLALLGASAMGGEAPEGGMSGAERPGGAGEAVAVVNGYVDQRLSYTRVDPSGPVATRDVPSLLELFEANVQLRVNLGDPRFFVSMDASFFYQGGWLFYDVNPGGAEVRVPEHDVASLRPFVVPSELYLSLSPVPWLNVLAGKKRITWGSGFAFNPTDLVNPPKDPTDPNSQRAGNWLVRVEAPFEKVTVSGLFAPQALSTQAGIPYAMLKYPSYPPADGADTRDADAHYLVAARLYLLLADADINLVYFFSHKYQNDFTDKSQVGVSFSRYFFTDYELHLEALLSQGSAKLYPTQDVARPLVASKVDSAAFLPRVLVGTRRQFADESLFSLEYYYQGDGYSPLELADTVRLLASAKAAGQGTGGTGGTGTGGTSGALPQRFSFDPLRRHYLIASYTKPRIFDDWTASAVLIAGLEDLSGVVAPSVTWSAREWLTVGLYGFIPVRGLRVGEVTVGDKRYSEYGLAPYDFRVMLELRAFY